eukprot:2108602-Rhodomonas_salina.1
MSTERNADLDSVHARLTGYLPLACTQVSIRETLLANKRTMSTGGQTYLTATPQGSRNCTSPLPHSPKVTTIHPFTSL